MAGLLQQGMAPQGAQPSPQAQPGQPQQPPQSGDPRIDTDPQQGPQQRNQLVNAMLGALYGPMLDQAAAIIDQHRENPEQGMARVIAQLITVTWKRLAEQGKAVPPGVLFQAAMMVAQAVGDMAIRMQVIPQEDGETIERAFMVAMGEFGNATRQEMPPEQRRRYSDLIQALDEGRSMAIGQSQPPSGGQAQPDASVDPRMQPQGGR